MRKSIKSETVFTKEEMNNEYNIVYKRRVKKESRMEPYLPR